MSEGAAWSMRPSKEMCLPKSGSDTWTAPMDCAMREASPYTRGARTSVTIVGAPMSLRYVTVDTCGVTFRPSSSMA